MSYKFRLESILKMHKSDEAVLSVELMQAESAHQLEINKLNELKDEFNSIEKEKFTNIIMIQNKYMYKDVLKDKIDIQADKVDLASKKVADVREELIEKQVKKKPLERAKEKELADYNENLAYKELDEISTQRYNYNRVNVHSAFKQT